MGDMLEIYGRYYPGYSYAVCGVQEWKNQPLRGGRSWTFLPKNPKVEHRRNLLILLTFSEKLNIEHSVLCRMFSFLARK